MRARVLRASSAVVFPNDPVGRPTWVCKGLRSFVETRGGDYFFLPGIAALRHIAAGTVEIT